MDCLVPRRVLRKTPSRRHGVTAKVEEQLRIFGADLIQRAAVLLRQQQVTSVGAAAIFQRFFFRRSFAEVDVRIAAAACLHLAGKIEEDHRRLRDVVVIFHRLWLRSQPRGDGDERPLFAGGPTPLLETNSLDFVDIKQDVIVMERVLLKELGFAVGLLLEHPHKYVLQFVKSLVRSPTWLVGELAQSAWGYLNDSTRTVVSCMYEPHKIATAAIYLAARARKVKLPSRPPWWELFDTELVEIRRIAGLIMRLYSLPPARHAANALPLFGPRALALQEPATPCLDTPGPLPSPSDDELPSQQQLLSPSQQHQQPELQSRSTTWTPAAETAAAVAAFARVDNVVGARSVAAACTGFADGEKVTDSAQHPEPGPRRCQSDGCVDYGRIDEMLNEQPVINRTIAEATRQLGDHRFDSQRGGSRRQGHDCSRSRSRDRQKASVPLDLCGLF
eukprot:TRINITY_DN19768_c0_g2_i4.p1 TRINITY_DN19768_c0_g2~~TRINITY_DN19768_c0_g2_i4.p1  ORF type:complete len:447 (-),score=76.88 TRINITY_DN19768_c0_g2_i4:218-1558(-)